MLTAFTDTFDSMIVYSSPAAVREFIGASVYDALPDAIQKDVDALSRDYDGQTMELIEELSKGVSEGDPVAVSERIHLSVITAPVFVHASEMFEKLNRTIRPVDALYEIWSMLHGYWDTSNEELLLSCERRRNVARGVVIHHLLTPMKSLHPSALFDVYYQFVGKNFETMDDDCLSYILEEGVTVQRLTEYVNGDYSTISYGHEHRMSFLTDSQLDAFVKEVADIIEDPTMTNERGMGTSGVYLTLEYYHFMERRARMAGYENDEMPAWSLAQHLYSEEDMSHFGVVTMLADFDESSISTLLDKTKDFTAYERKVVGDAISHATDQHGVMEMKFIERIIILSADLAPLIAKFYAAGYQDHPDGSLWRTLDEAYGPWDKRPDLDIARGKALYSYSCWSGGGIELEGEDLKWAGQHALELADHAAFLMDIGPRDRASYEQMLERPALASGVL